VLLRVSITSRVSIGMSSSRFNMGVNLAHFSRFVN
jgi:hypothetical protein